MVMLIGKHEKNIRALRVQFPTQSFLKIVFVTVIEEFIGA